MEEISEVEVEVSRIIEGLEKMADEPKKEDKIIDRTQLTVRKSGDISLLGALKEGDCVKVNNRYDCFWVKVRDIDKGSGEIVGKVSSDINKEIGYERGDLLRFMFTNVLEVERGGETMCPDSDSEEDKPELHIHSSINYLNEGDYVKINDGSDCYWMQLDKVCYGSQYIKGRVLTNKKVKPNKKHGEKVKVDAGYIRAWEHADDTGDY